MSNGEAHSEDMTILAAVEALGREIDLPEGVTRPDEASETLARLYNEVLGLLPFELEPVEPSPEARTRLMALLHGDETQPAAEQARASVPLSSSREMRPARAAPAPQPPLAATRPARRSWWPTALAAALALVALGLSAWLYLQLGQHQRTIAQLRQELEGERSRLAAALAEVRKAETGASDLRERFQLVTSPAVEVSPMRPVGEPPPQPEAHGILFVAADHQHWYLSVRNLQPATAGKAYKLWFMTDQGAVSFGHFTAEPGEHELASAHMPAGTKGVLVTLEDNPEVAAPTGPKILEAAAVYKIS